jgi:hypothetical protein
MSEDIAKTRDASPFYGGVARSNVGRDPFDCLSNPCHLPTMALLAHTVDNNTTTGPAIKSLFPSGREADVKPGGTAQISVAVTLRERLDSQPAATKVKVQVMNKFDQSFTAFKRAIDGRQAAKPS